MTAVRHSNSIGTALAALLAAGAVQAQDTTTSYTFDSYGVRTICTVDTQGAVVRRSITSVYSSDTTLVDRAPTDAHWITSGCEDYIRRQTRPVSSEEYAQRMDGAARPLTYEGAGGLREQVVALMCADRRNADSAECRKP
jgi:hypothetical protein